ncbi:MAG: winged helix-turn-helix domain-containing protein [Hyphomicrobiales bacterium]|nr:winged helix-turn-helix domain-containing protein [Hyphomicrobiales bacterium]
MELTEFGRLIGQESRVSILLALMGGTALPASELAYRAGVANQTASSHLNELTRGGLIRRRKCGRYHYYELAGGEVASLIENLARDLPDRKGGKKRPRIKPELKSARFCYDHLAGELGVAISRGLVAKGALFLEEESFRLPDNGHRIYEDIGMDLAALRLKKRKLCPRCVDWSERLPHVAGSFGAAFAEKMLEHGFIRRSPNNRSVAVTQAGRSFFSEVLNLDLSFLNRQTAVPEEARRDFLPAETI